jgi:oligogalacturonide lyase
MRESGGFGLDADEKFAVLGCRGGDVGEHLPSGVEVQGIPAGARMGAGPGGLRKIDLASGEISVIIDTPFQMGTCRPIRGFPTKSSTATKPAATRRSDLDGEGRRLGQSAAFEEGPLDWVTHETL